MNAYISYSALDAALKTKDSELKKILNQLSEYLGTIYTDLKPQELMVIMRDSENPLSMLCRQDVKVVADPKLFATLKTNHSSVLRDPAALYIIDLPEATTQMIQNNYGVLCRSVSK